MTKYNYVATAVKASTVYDSVAGNFTGSDVVNLIVGKGNRMEIFIFADDTLKSVLDTTINGRIRTLQLFRPCGELCDLLFVFTEMLEYLVLQWDPVECELVTRSKGVFLESLKICRTEADEQIAVIDPDCRLIGLHLFFGFLEVIPLDEKGHFKNASHIELEENNVMDIKFLFGCAKPTLVVLYATGDNDYHVKTYEIFLKDEEICSSEGPWSINLCSKARLLIPVPSPLYGILIIGKRSVQYFSASVSKSFEFINATTRHYGRLDGDELRYLLGDRNGLLHLLLITQENGKFVGLDVNLVGEASAASTISSVGKEVVYVGSCIGDSQLIKIRPLDDGYGSCAEALESYVNLGPIFDLCVVESQRHGKGTIATCSGSAKYGSVCILRYGFGIDKLASAQCEGITGIWSLQSATSDLLLVVSFVQETRILEMSKEDELEETEVKGFLSEVQTLFCHEAQYNQLIQVTSTSVRLVSFTSRELVDEWKASDKPIIVATANRKQIAVIDPDCRLIGLHLFFGFLEVIPLDEKGHFKNASHIELEENNVMDIKFLFGCAKPTLVVLYATGDNDYHVKTYEIFLKDEEICSSEGPWSINLCSKARLLIPVPSPLYGILIIGKRSVQYFSASVSKSFEFINATTRHYGRLDGDELRYLLGDRNGLLHLLLITQENGKFVGLDVNLVGEASAASTISSVGKEVVYVGSCIGDSQLIKIRPLDDGYGSCAEALESYVNLGPIFDLCVVESQRHGKGTIATCSGSAKYGSVCILRYGFGIDKLASAQCEGITGIWSLQSATSDLLLVVSFVQETRILEMSKEDELEETEVKGFLSEVQTLFCHEAQYNQLIQVTSTSVRLVSFTSRELVDEWKASDKPIIVATANRKQVLLAGHDYLVYLEIGVGVLNEMKYETIKYDVSCLDISPIGEDQEYSKLATVGMWTNTCVGIFVLPNLQLLTKEYLGGGNVSRSVLMCKLDGISYLLCAIGDGHLLIFLLNQKTGRLTDMIKVPLGSQPISLRTFSFKNTTHIFAASDKPAVIYSSNKKLLYSSVIDLKEVSQVCPFNTAAFPDSLAFAEDGELTICTVDYPKFLIQSVPLQEQAVVLCHQNYSQSFALCCEKFMKPSRERIGSIHLLNDQSLKFKSSFSLDQYEFGTSIISCSFYGDDNVYYCVGTGYTDEHLNVIEKGRVLILLVEDGRLKLIAEKQINKCAGSLNAFQGKLLVLTDNKVKLYKWLLHEDGTCELQFECENVGTFSCSALETRGNLILVGGELEETLSVMIYEHEKRAIEELDCYRGNWSTSIKILDDDLYLAGDTESNIFTVCKDSDNAIKKERLQGIGKYHLGELVIRFHHGSLLMGMPESCIGEIPTCIFGTESGSIGIIASIPQDQYFVLDKLQSVLIEVVKSVGGLSHRQWRSYISAVESKVKMEDAKNFLDGDLIESFLDLSLTEMEVVSKAMSESVEVLKEMVKDLTKLR
ncbi:DNA damage-binding protein 1a [Heracleum sosnowskyi]|uniref:DNA damage-binding protein 1a n=1 Tax=Heracleum sosnowskyi TaxID=360622 RepID=A0AAD8J510_9APIA|nr:DNA damage-binding protein 1a [Heracleum sosnowskyi]